MTNNNSLTLGEQLNLPFSYEEYGVNYEGQVYISAQSVVERLNDVFGLLNWEMEPISIEVNQEYYSVSVLGELRVYDADRDRWVSRRQYGNDTMTIKRDETTPTGQAFEDAKKSAITDSLKKCASWIGVASDVYSNRLYAISKRKSESAYQTALQHFNLRREEYENGVVVLPDSYREYYESKKWPGIFHSEVVALFGNAEDLGKRTDGYNPSSSAAKSGSNSQSAGNSNSPLPYRIMINGNPEVQQDGSVKFTAMMEDQSSIQVIVPKDKSNIVLPLQIGTVIKLKGWLNPQTGFLRVSKKQIEVENRSSQRTA